MTMLTRSIGLLLGLFAFAGIALGADRPNVVWLISEDNSKHFLKLFDEHGAPTPHIRQLAEHGLLFEHAFSNAPVCSVARTTLITGCYGPRIGTQYHRKSVEVPMPTGLQMFPAYLREAGYYTTNNQKKDYNAIEGKGVWDVSSRQANWRNREKGQPFFHMQSFGTSHESSLHFTEKQMQTQKTQTPPDSVFIPPIHPNTPTFRYTYARYHDRIQEVDRQIGQVVADLEKDGLIEDTFIFYFGDHGGVLPGSKGYAHETGLHVPLVVRVPEKWKHLVDVELGSRVNGFVSFVDFGPTVLHLAGVKVPDGVDGHAFLGEGITLKELNQRDEAFGYADRFDEKYDLVRTLRKGQFKYVRNYQPFNYDGLHNNYRYKMLAYQEWRELFIANKLDPVQAQFFTSRDAEALYDLEADPYETKNLAGDPAHAEKLTELREGLRNWVKGMPDLSFYPESVFAEKAFSNPVAFGQAHKEDISLLVDVADLELVPTTEAEDRIAAALASDDPWVRYWALIVCSSHGAKAKPIVETAGRLAADDPELLVRVRAAEFLGLIGEADPRPVIMDALSKSRSHIEAGLILNSVVLLQDSKPGHEFTITASTFKGLGRGMGDTVNRRLEYLK